MANYLIGNGELLTYTVPPPPKIPDKKYPYSFLANVRALADDIQLIAKQVDRLPEAACPFDTAIFNVTLHPSFLAKSYFPERLLTELHFSSVGCKGINLIPRTPTRGNQADVPNLSPQFFISGSRLSIRQFAENLLTWKPKSQAVRKEFSTIELVHSLEAERVRPFDRGSDTVIAEIVLHYPYAESTLLNAFINYTRFLGLDTEIGEPMKVGGLLFFPMALPASETPRLADFSFLRVARPLPKLRLSDTIVRSVGLPRRFQVKLPQDGPVDTSLPVAVFDGGEPDDGELAPWVRRLDAPSLRATNPQYLMHGRGVSSACLFGPLQEGQDPERPYAHVDHWRVLDVATDHDDPYALFSVLRRIKSVLDQNQYRFANISLGPDLPVEDDEVHVWTALLDDYSKRGDTLFFVAAGNTGELDHPSGNARIQPPSEIVSHGLV